MTNESKANGNGSILKKAHITYTFAIIVGTISVLAWFNSTYVTAKEFSSFKEQTLTSLSRMELNSRKSDLLMRNRVLDDKLFELQTISSDPISSANQAMVHKVLRELETNKKELTELQKSLNKTKSVSSILIIEEE